MLAAGLLARWAFTGLGKKLARNSALRIPPLLSYAIAGVLAALSRAALGAWTALGSVPIWIAFGAVWGIVAGILLPFSSRRQK